MHGIIHNNNSTINKRNTHKSTIIAFATTKEGWSFVHGQLYISQKCHLRFRGAPTASKSPRNLRKRQGKVDSCCTIVVERESYNRGTCCYFQLIPHNLEIVIFYFAFNRKKFKSETARFRIVYLRIE